MLGWTVLWVVAVWAIDPASTVGGKPPSWVLFELWALGFVLLGALLVGLVAVGDSWRARVDLRRLRSAGGVVLGWTVLWMALLVAWALDPARSDLGQGPGPTSVGDLKPSEPMLYAVWSLGLVLLATAWLVARARTARRDRA
jgi:hypothetical protein